MYKIMSFPYSYEDLEPFIDTHLLGLHYQKHQKGYLKRLNELLDKNNDLKIKNYLNQDCPYFYGLVPLLCIDVWEHAYYINYENKRDLYIDNFFEIMDYDMANKGYQTVICNELF